ncbi:MAG: chemotaxis protein [Burkholderiales bacterium PBB6]|nr:MAG: chemotaxis protein [Burkholderiales bacterium PBB6]
MNHAPDLTITPDDLAQFSAYFHRQSGIWFDDSKRYFLEKRLQDRIRIQRAPNFAGWFRQLRGDTQGLEFQAVVNAMTVNETYFFREAYQFDCLVNHLMNEVRARKAPGETIRIWSVPSSTGEEPYSIAIYLLERWRHINEVDVEILSSDIDTQVLAAAQTGVYSRRSVGELPANLLRKYFKPVGNDEFEISRDLVDAVEFSRVNLCKPAETRNFRNIDIVFCRNLLIYFDDESRDTALQALHASLNPQGFLCLGHSESIGHGPKGFEMRRFPDALIYQKKA